MWRVDPLQNPDSPEVVEALTRVCPVCHRPVGVLCDESTLYVGVVHRSRTAAWGTSGGAA